MDLWLPDGRHMPSAAFDEVQLRKRPTAPGIVVPVVGDFKTSKDIGRWSKTTKGLSVDVQAQLYATWAMFATGARVVDLIWIYFQTLKPYKTKRVHLRVLAEDVLPQFKRIDATAVRMFEARAAAEGKEAEAYALSLKPNIEMCEQYGGCPYRFKCNLSPDESVDAIAAKDAAQRRSLIQKNGVTLTTTAGLFANLKKKQAPPAEAPPAPATTPAPTPPTITEPPPGIMGCANTDVPAPTEIPKWMTEPTPPQPGVNPPESALPPAPATGAAAPVATPEPAKPRRGRPPKAKPDPVGADIAAHTGADEKKPADYTTSDAAAQDAIDRAVKKCEPPPAAPAAAPAETTDELVTVTWGEEQFQPVPFNHFKVGPYSVQGKVRVGETRADAARRLANELAAFAIEQRRIKAESFAAALGMEKES